MCFALPEPRMSAYQNAKNSHRASAVRLSPDSDDSAASIRHLIETVWSRKISRSVKTDADMAISQVSAGDLSRRFYKFFAGDAGDLLVMGSRA
jgi:hypothetical protein